jgi:hypothetical protein
MLAVPTVDTSVCVFCRREPMLPEHRPFCSDRCRLQDLARWADGTYRAAGAAVTDETDTQQPERIDTTPDHG